MKRTSLTLSFLLILFAGGVYAENSDKEFTCDLDAKIYTLDLITGKNELLEDQITWIVKVNIPEKIFSWGDGAQGNRACRPWNENKLTVDNDYLHCQQKIDGGVEKREIKTDLLTQTHWYYPSTATLNRYSLLFKYKSRTMFVGKLKGGGDGFGSDMRMEYSGTCKEAKRKF